MLFRISLVLAALLSVLWIWHTSNLPAIFEKPILHPGDYAAFSAAFKTLVLLIGLLLFLSVFWRSPKTTTKASSATWIISFVFALGSVAGLVAFVNPTGRFPWNERDSYVSVVARSIKPNLYAKLNTTPKLIILGSSVSFTTPADYLKDKWGVSAFNMSLNGGGPSDFVNMMNYIIQQSPDGKTPSTLLVEIVSPALRNNDSNQTPLKIIPYLPLEQGIPALGETIDSLIQMTPLSDAVFTPLFFDTNRWKIWIKFSNDGTGIRSGGGELLPAYQAATENSIGIMKSLLSCSTPDPAGKASIEALIEISHRYPLSIVFYRTPINRDFYSVSKTKPNQYEKCKENFDAYMLTLTQKNNNVFFKDLSQYPEISTQGMTVYMDTHHLKKPGAILLIDALDAEIESALQWARKNHK